MRSTRVNQGMPHVVSSPPGSRRNISKHASYNTGLLCRASYSIQNDKLIRSQNNAHVKHCVKLLTSKKYREEQRKVMLCGLTLVEEIGPYLPEIASVFYIGDDHSSVLDDPYLYMDSPFVRQLLENSNCRYNVTKQIMGKICNITTVHESHVAAEVDLPLYQDFRSYAPGTLRRLLVLDKIQDPGNLGTLLRSCLAFEFDGIYLLPGCADPFNDKTVRASRGACFRMPLMCGNSDNWKEVVDTHGLVPVAADLVRESNGDDRQALGLDSGCDDELLRHLGAARVSLVVGSEGTGLTEEMRRHCRLVSIPMSDEMESLNAATAASIIMCMLSPSGAGPLINALAKALRM
jgi:TrmH family RNA methyltransferase